MKTDKKLRRELIITSIIIIIVVLLVVLIAEADQIRRLIWGVEKDVFFLDKNVGRYLRREVKQIVKSYSRQLTSYPVSAAVDTLTGEVKAESSGKIVALTETVDKVFKAAKGSRVFPVFYKIKPYLKEREIKKITKVLDSYTTIITGDEGRRKNIELAAKLINNQLVLPGEVFSFNKVVGPRTKEKGFKEAPVLVDGKLTSGIGGGVCQVSSTLYNAVDVEKIKVIERHSHSREVSYVPQGKDATVAWDYFDFKFKNKFAHPLIVKAEIKGERLKVFILGSEEGKGDKK